MPATDLIRAIRLVLGHAPYRLAFLILSGFLMWFFVYIPVRSIPGNDFIFQLSIMTTKDFILLITMSSLTALSLVMNVYLLQRQWHFRTGIGLVGQGGVGSVAGVIGSVFGTASCSSCAVSLFGFLGIGSVFFLLEYRQVITLATIVLLLITLHFTAQSVLGVCHLKSKKLSNTQRQTNSVKPFSTWQNLW